MVQSNSLFFATPVFNGTAPKEDSCVVPVGYDWSVGVQSYTTSLQAIQATARISGVQTLFIDNSVNDAPITVAIAETSQSITVAAGYQGYFPVLCTSRINFVISSASTLRSSIVSYLNFPLAYGIWPAYGTLASPTTPIPVTDAALEALIISGRFNVRSIDAQCTDASSSGTITLGGTAQTAAALNANRRGWQLQNIDVAYPTEEIWYSTTGAAAIGGAGSFALSAYSAAGFPGGAATGKSSNAISVIAASTGHKFSLITW